MFDPKRPVIQINIYLGLGSLPFIMAWLFRTQIMDFVRSIVEQMPF